MKDWRLKDYPIIRSWFILKSAGKKNYQGLPHVNLFIEQSSLIMMISCNICNHEFSNRNTRDAHRKSTCLLSVKVKKSNGEEQVIERVNGKFTCLCGTSVTWTDDFQKHWKKCQIQG